MKTSKSKNRPDFDRRQLLGTVMVSKAGTKLCKVLQVRMPTVRDFINVDIDDAGNENAYKVFASAVNMPLEEYLDLSIVDSNKIINLINRAMGVS